MFHYKVYKTVEYVCIAVLSPLSVLVAAIVVQKLIAHSKLCQEGLIAMRQFLVSMVGDDGELVDDGQQMDGLLVGQRTEGGVVEFLVVVAEGVETEVVEHFRRYEQQGIGKVVGTLYGVHDMAWKNDGQVVFVMSDDSHVVHSSCTAAQNKSQDDVREYEIFVVSEEAWHLSNNQDVTLLDGL